VSGLVRLRSGQHVDLLRPSRNRLSRLLAYGQWSSHDKLWSGHRRDRGSLIKCGLADRYLLLDRACRWLWRQPRPVPSRGTRQIVWNRGLTMHCSGIGRSRTWKAHGERVLYESCRPDSKEGFLQSKPSIGLLSELKSEEFHAA
jgi:hypothetical protein